MRPDSNVIESKAFVLRVIEFTATPGPRYRSEGKYSGQEFREEFLEPRYKKARSEGKTLIVDLDGTAGYASSFLEESFGGLARIYPMEEVLETIQVKSDTRPWYVEEVMKEHIPESGD